MKDLDRTGDRLSRIAADVEDRIHWQADGSGLALAAVEPPSLRQLLDRFASDAFVRANATGPMAELTKLAGTRLPAAQQEEVEARLPRLARLFATYRDAQNTSLALGIKLRAAEAQKVLSAEPRGLAAIVTSGAPTRARSPLKVRFGEMRDGVSASIQRAVDLNGVVSRPAETLIASLVTLVPAEEGQRKVYQRSHVTDAFIFELATAMEIAGRDYSLLLGDHFEVFWRTGILPNIGEEMEITHVVAQDFTASKMREQFAISQLFDAIHKATDDFRLRMRSGGVSALVLAAPKPFGAGDVLKNAVRYPMQYVALLTYLVLPILVVFGFAGDSAAGSILKGIIPFIIPLLVAVAFLQARAIRRSALDAALEAARRQLRAEASKTVREIGDAISTSYQAFLTSTESLVETAVLGKAKQVREDGRKEDEAKVEMRRMALDSRIDALETLQTKLQSAIGDAGKAIVETIATLLKLHKPPRRRAGEPAEETRA